MNHLIILFILSIYNCISKNYIINGFIIGRSVSIERINREEKEISVLEFEIYDDNDNLVTKSDIEQIIPFDSNTNNETSSTNCIIDQIKMEKGCILTTPKDNDAVIELTLKNDTKISKIIIFASYDIKEKASLIGSSVFIRDKFGRIVYSTSSISEIFNIYTYDNLIKSDEYMKDYKKNGKLIHAEVYFPKGINYIAIDQSSLPNEFNIEEVKIYDKSGKLYQYGLKSKLYNGVDDESNLYSGHCLLDGNVYDGGCAAKTKSYGIMFIDFLLPMDISGIVLYAGKNQTNTQSLYLSQVLLCTLKECQTLPSFADETPNETLIYQFLIDSNWQKPIRAIVLNNQDTLQDSKAKIMKRHSSQVKEDQDNFQKIVSEHYQ